MKKQTSGSQTHEEAGQQLIACQPLVASPRLASLSLSLSSHQGFRPSDIRQLWLFATRLHTCSYCIYLLSEPQRLPLHTSVTEKRFVARIFFLKNTATSTSYFILRTSLYMYKNTKTYTIRSSTISTFTLFPFADYFPSSD